MSRRGKANQFAAESTLNVSDGWMLEEDDVEGMESHTAVKSEDIGPLLGGFADAESATK